MSALEFPPLFQGLALPAGGDPFAEALGRARSGCDAGLVTHAIAADWMRAAIVFAPEVPLTQAMAMLPVCGVGFQNALGALAPPEVAVHLDWDGTIRLNGGRAGRLRAAAATLDPQAIPDWLVIGLELAILPPPDLGRAPDATGLLAEGCGEVEPAHLIEAWARHSLVWINRWEDEGLKAVHGEWSALAWDLGKPLRRRDAAGTFLGVDEAFGLLLQTEAGSRLIPLTDLLEPVP